MRHRTLNKNQCDISSLRSQHGMIRPLCTITKTRCHMYSNFEQENTDQNSSYKNFLIYVQGTLPKGELLSGMQAYTNSTAEINCWDK